MLADDPLFCSACTKIGLLALTGASSHLSLSPPNAPVPARQCLRAKALFERCVRWVTFCSKTMVWVVVLLDAYATYKLYNQLHRSSISPMPAGTPNASSSPLLTSTNTSSSQDPYIPTIPTSQSLLSVSPLFLLGAICVLLGASLRLWCFKTLGDCFTFELTIRPSHSLATTGPYAFVRHPSYTGIFLTLLGASAVGLAPGTILRESWIVPLQTRCTRAALTSSPGSCVPLLPMTLGQAIICVLVSFWCVKVWYALRSTLRRLEVEDDELHRVFREAWEEWAERVPWKLLPGVF